MTIKERYEGIIGWFSENMPEPETELHYDSPFHLLLAVILSAQCTDKRVNMVTPALFEAFPTPEALASASEEEVFPYIKSVTFPNNKTRHLIRAARVLCEEFGGEMPSDIDSLMKLPGVGRKTANVMLAVVWNKAAMAVDTHARQTCPGRSSAQGTSLAHTPRPLRMHCPETQLRGMRNQALLPRMGEKRKKRRIRCNNRPPDTS